MRVSCVVPVHDGERFLREALDSVFAQRHDDLEVIVVDDGSTDGTAEILASYGDALTVVQQEQAGPAAARNRGLDLATGELIAFQDADDLWEPRKLELQLERFRARPELELCVGLLQNFWMDELAEERRRFECHAFSRPLPGYSFPNLLAKHALFERVGRLDPDLRLAEDNDWFMRAREAGVIEELIPEVLVRRRLHRGNVTRQDLASRDALLANMKAALDRRRASGS